MSIITVENLSHIYSANTPFQKTAIDGISLSIGNGQLIGLLGHTGSGKSTFIQHLNALLIPTSGTVFLDGADINESKISRRDVKWRVGLVFQYPEYQLFEETVYKDIAFGPANMKLSAEEIDARVREAAAFAGVDEKLFEKSPLGLSGGQKRRIAIAGVIAMRPDFLILDEPTAGLDPAGCKRILDNILAYKEKTNSTVIIVSHNMDEIASIADRLIVFNKSKVVLDGTPAEVFSHVDYLTSIGLNVPQSAAIANELRKRGLDIPENIFTGKQLCEEIVKLKGIQKC